MSECSEFGEIGPRIYGVEVDGVLRVYVEESAYDGAINVIECQQNEDQGCPAMGYHYRGVLYLYGTHNHKWVDLIKLTENVLVLFVYVL